MSEPRECPFCGKNNWQYHVGISYGEYECLHCGARTPHAVDKAQATILANARADDALMDDMATALSEALDLAAPKNSEDRARIHYADGVLARYRERGK